MMIFCSIYIDYISQLQRCETQGIAQLLQSIRTIAAAFGGIVYPREHPLMLAFPDDTLFSLFQVTEAVRQARVSLSESEKKLRGFCMVLEACEESDEAYARCYALHFEAKPRKTFIFSDAARTILKDYFDFLPSEDENQEVIFRHDAVLGTADASPLYLRPQICKSLRAFLDSPKAGQTKLIHVKTDPGVRSVRAFEEAFTETESQEARLDSELLLNLYTGGSSREAFLPFPSRLGDRHIALAQEQADQEELVMLQQGEPAFQYARRAMFRKELPSWLTRSCESYISLVIDLASRNIRAHGKIPWIICNEPELFSDDAIRMLSKRIGAKSGCHEESPGGREHYLTASPSQAMSTMRCKNAIVLDAAVSRRETRDQALKSCFATDESASTPYLERHFRALSGAAEARTLPALTVLSFLPQEASIYLYALLLTQNLLNKDNFLTFMTSLGLFGNGAAVLENLLVKAGLLDPLDTMIVLGSVSKTHLDGSLSSQIVADIVGKFSGFLVKRYQKGSIEPSLDFLEHIGDEATEERLVFDCIMSTAVRPDKSPNDPVDFLSPASQCLLQFYSAASEPDDRKAAKALVASTELITGPRAKAVCALMHSEFAYAEGSTERAGKSAKEALLSIGRGAPPKLEARTQRMMGLVSLAGERFVEAIDYFGNAQEIAELSRDEYERFYAAYAKAIAEYMTGALVRSQRALDTARQCAYRQCRPDLVIAAGFLQGRIEMELGSYDQGARLFASLSALALAHGLADAAARADIWRGRSLSYAGMYPEAMAVFELYPDDAEAAVFWGEAEILRGNPQDALLHLATPLQITPRRFLPPDCINWSSTFAEVEGRSIAFEQADAPLKDMQTALMLFAKGLVSEDPSFAADLHALTRNPRVAKSNPALAMFSFFCFLMEERLPDPPVDRQTVLSRAFKALQQRAGKIEDRAQRALFMDKNLWNCRLIEVARTHKFI